MNNAPVAHDIYDWHGLHVLVTRVSRRGQWADIEVSRVSGDRLVAMHTKRQPLPFPADFIHNAGAKND